MLHQTYHFKTYNQEKVTTSVLRFISLETYHFTKENVIHAHLHIASKSELIQFLMKKSNLMPIKYSDDICFSLTLLYM